VSSEAVRFEGVSKRFIIHHQRARTFQEAALNLLRLGRVNGTREEFWALRDVTFSVPHGRTLGIIGRNGSGKSTLLKLLAGTMRPTSGRIVADGKVFGLLELAAGFHPELSGRENIFLNGTFLGLSRREMARRLDGIVAFAELEQFIDTPVKHYSSGMYMRLGFAIAINVDPDILVIDEVLAVGDAAFRRKCFLALADYKARGKTILFVTHDPAAVRRFCDEVIWLDQGRVRAAGGPEQVLQEYLAATQSVPDLPRHTGEADGPVYRIVPEARQRAGAERPSDAPAEPSGPVTLLSVETIDGAGRPERHFRSGQVAGVRVRLRAEQEVSELSIGVAIHRADGLYLAGTSTGAAGRRLSARGGEGAVTCWLGPLPLSAAEYTVSAAAWIGDSATPIHRLSQAARFAVRPPRTDQAGMLVLAPRWEATGSAALLPAAVARDGAPAVRAALPDLPRGQRPPPSASPPTRVHGDSETRGEGDTEMWGQRDVQTWRRGDVERGDEGHEAALSGTFTHDGRWESGRPTSDGRSNGSNGAVQLREAGVGSRQQEGGAADQALPVDGFYARWRRPPARIAMGEGEDEFLGPGWYPPEDWPPRVRWTAGEATAYLTQDEWASALGITMCQPQHGDRPATGRVYVDGHLVGEFRLASPGLEPLTFLVPPVDQAREVAIRLEVDDVLEPATSGASDDRRKLGVAVHSMWFE
jgi:lipopolysaccharide transport system ATP-binding protein